MTKSKRKARAAKKDVKRAEKVLIIFKSKSHTQSIYKFKNVYRKVKGTLARYNQSNDFRNAWRVRKIIHISGSDNQSWGTADIYKLYAEQDTHL